MVEANKQKKMTKKRIVIPCEIVNEMNQKGERFALPLFFAICDYFFKGIPPKGLNKEQTNLFQKVCLSIQKKQQRNTKNNGTRK